MGLLSLAIYLGLSLTSDAIVQDSVYSVGISICVYYIVAALSSVVYFHRTAFGSVRTALGQVILPGFSALVLSAVLVLEARNMTDPDYGSGNAIRGVGTVFIIGVHRHAPGAPGDGALEHRARRPSSAARHCPSSWRTG